MSYLVVSIDTDINIVAVDLKKREMNLFYRLEDAHKRPISDLILSQFNIFVSSNESNEITSITVSRPKRRASVLATGVKGLLDSLLM